MITDKVARLARRDRATDGLLTLFIRHTSASLLIQENADPDVHIDLVNALERLAPKDIPYVHDIEGPDDMPAHIKSALTATSLSIPVRVGPHGARHLAGHLRRRAPRPAAPARGRRCTISARAQAR